MQDAHNDYDITDFHAALLDIISVMNQPLRDEQILQAAGVQLEQMLFPLLVALRSIAILWRYEHQSRNAQQIADRASKLYDKMRLFIDDMSAIGQSLDKAQDNYRQAMKKLSSGRGNVLAQAEAFRGLGVEIKREINPDLAEQAVSQDEEYRLRSVPEQPNDEAYQRDDEYNQQSR